MKTILKYAATVALTGALALAAATPSKAWHGHNAAAIGFGVGAVAGAAIASSAYNNGYYYGDPGYAYAPGYAYDASVRVRRFIRLRTGDRATATTATAGRVSITPTTSRSTRSAKL